MESNLQILLLKNGNLSDYLIGKVTQLDEEPAVLVEGCYRSRRWCTRAVS